MKNINHPNYYRKEITIFVEKKKKGMIDQATIDRIMAATDIVEVVSDFVSLRKRGANYWGLCPFHDDKTPSFSVSQSKGVCKCFQLRQRNVVRSISLWNMSNYRITKH